MNVELGFSRMDIEVAKVVVKRLVRNGWRRGPSDMLVLNDYALERWYEEDAIAWLKEQKEQRQQPLELL